MAAERKQKYWGEERNARRREQYATDPERAEAIRQQRRESYARRTGKVPAKTCLGNVGKVPSAGTVMAVHVGKGPFVIGRVFTQTDVAEMLDRQPQVIYRWHQREIFPSPVLFDDKGNRYYADVEVIDFIKIMGEHQKETPHYRQDHTDVRDMLFKVSFEKNQARLAQWLKERQ